MEPSGELRPARAMDLNFADCSLTTRAQECPTIDLLVACSPPQPLESSRDYHLCGLQLGNPSCRRSALY